MSFPKSGFTFGKSRHTQIWQGIGPLGIAAGGTVGPNSVISLPPLSWTVVPGSGLGVTPNSEKFDVTGLLTTGCMIIIPWLHKSTDAASASDDAGNIYSIHDEFDLGNDGGDPDPSQAGTGRFSVLTATIDDPSATTIDVVPQQNVASGVWGFQGSIYISNIPISISGSAESSFGEGVTFDAKGNLASVTLGMLAFIAIFPTNDLGDIINPGINSPFNLINPLTLSNQISTNRNGFLCGGYSGGTSGNLQAILTDNAHPTQLTLTPLPTIGSPPSSGKAIILTYTFA